MKAGFYLMRRGWRDLPALKGPRPEPFTRRDAFCWLMEEAAFEARTEKLGAERIELKRGQISASYRFLATAWMWPIGKVQRFVSMLNRWRIIDTEIDTGRLLLTICNYDELQSPTSARDTHVDTSSIRHRYELKEIKEINTPLSPPTGGQQVRRRRGREAEPATPVRDPEDARWLARLRGWTGTRRFWNEGQWGPPPDQPGCAAPLHLVAEAMAANPGPRIDVDGTAQPPPALVPPTPPPMTDPRRLVRDAKRSQLDPAQPQLLLPSNGGKIVVGYDEPATTEEPRPAPPIRGVA